MIHIGAGFYGEELPTRNSFFNAIKYVTRIFSNKKKFFDKHKFIPRTPYLMTNWPINIDYYSLYACISIEILRYFQTALGMYKNHP